MKKSPFMYMALSASWVSLTAMASSSPVAQHQDVQAGIKLTQHWMETQLEYDNVPGASIAVVHDQEVVWAKGFGFANLEDEVPATADTLYSICSVSKLFTSIGVMQLRDQNKLSLDTPIAEILDWYQVSDADNQSEAVTLRNILSHVAGLPREAVTPYWTEVDFPTRQAIQSGTKTQQSLYMPYQHFQYSNLGLTLAGEAIAERSDSSYHEYIKNNILSPLQMSDTYSELPVDLYGQQFSKGYKLKDSQGRRDDVGPYTTNALAPAAGYASSVNDLAKFAAWQFRLRDADSAEILKPTTLREMQRVHWTAPDMDGTTWGLGFAVYNRSGKTFVGHGGYCPGYRTTFFMRLPDEIAVIAMLNVNDVNPSTFARTAYELIAPAITSAVKSSADEQTSDSEDDSETADKVALSPFEGVYGRPDMPTRMAVAATSTGLKAIRLFTDEPYQRPIKLKHEQDGEFRVMSDKNEPLDQVRFEFDQQQQVTKLWRHGQYLDKMD